MSFLLTRYVSIKAIGITALFFVLNFSAWSQVEQPKRFEEVFQVDGTYQLLPCDTNGLMYWYISSLPNAYDTLALVLNRLDTALNHQWRRVYYQPRNYEFIGQKYFGNKAYLLFAERTLRARDLKIIEVDAISGYLKEYTINNIIPFQYIDMALFENSIAIAGYFNYRPLVISYNFQDRIPRILPGLFNEKRELSQLISNEDNTIDVLLSGKNILKNNTLTINTYDQSARLLRSVELPSDKKRSLLFGQMKLLPNGTQLVAGVYGNRNSEYSKGVFIANVNQFGESALRFYNYAEFENFFSYLRAKRQERIKRRIERKRIKNKKIRFNYRLLVHDIMPYKGQYILLGEAFYPKYKTVYGTPGLFQPGYTINRGIYSSTRVFEGYQYTHAVVIGFDVDGNVLWDNSFEIKDILSQRLKQFVHVDTDQDKINLLYVFDDQIRSKVIDENDVLEGKESTDIQLLYEGDRANKEGTVISGLTKWYGDVFITWGQQTIRNTVRNNINATREVFFVNKVVVK